MLNSDYNSLFVSPDFLTFYQSELSLTVFPSFTQGVNDNISTIKVEHTNYISVLILTYKYINP